METSTERMRAPIATTADLSFIRLLVGKGIEVTRLRKIANNHVDEMRDDIVKRVSEALIRRYKYHTRGHEPKPSFHDWIDGMKLEQTYKRGQNGFSLETRLRWASSPVRAAVHPSLSYTDQEGDGRWLYRDLTVALNAKMPSPHLFLYAGPALTPVTGQPIGVKTVKFSVVIDEEEIEEPEEE